MHLLKKDRGLIGKRLSNKTQTKITETKTVKVNQEI